MSECNKVNVNIGLFIDVLLWNLGNLLLQNEKNGLSAIELLLQHFTNK